MYMPKGVEWSGEGGVHISFVLWYDSLLHEAAHTYIYISILADIIYIPSFHTGNQNHAPCPDAALPIL